MSKTTGWSLATKEHTFSTGRQATLRMHPTFMGMIDDLDGMATEAGEDAAPTRGAMIYSILTSMWVRPRVVYLEEEALSVANACPKCGEEWAEERIWFVHLRDEEVLETIGLWKDGIGDADRFREFLDGPPAGTNGKGVADKPKRARGSKRPAGAARR